MQWRERSPSPAPDPWPHANRDPSLGWPWLASRLELHERIDVGYLTDGGAYGTLSVVGMSLDGDDDPPVIPPEAEHPVRRPLHVRQEPLRLLIERVLDLHIDLEVHITDRIERMFVVQRVPGEQLGISPSVLSRTGARTAALTCAVLTVLSRFCRDRAAVPPCFWVCLHARIPRSDHIGPGGHPVDNPTLGIRDAGVAGSNPASPTNAVQVDGVKARGRPRLGGFGRDSVAIAKSHRGGQPVPRRAGIGLRTSEDQCV